MENNTTERRKGTGRPPRKPLNKKQFGENKSRGLRHNDEDDNKRSKFRKDFRHNNEDDNKRSKFRKKEIPNYAGVSQYVPTPRKPKNERISEKKSNLEGVRLNKFISNSGICSRREADQYIEAGLVKVNNIIVTQLGARVMPGDVVKFNDEIIKGEEKVYILMNKPKDYVTTSSDPHAEKTVLDLIAGKCSERVYPVGRLDKSTTGVLLITNDGELTEKLTHPSYEKKKIYQATLDKNLKKSDLEAIINGITLEDGFIQADKISYLDGNENEIGIEIHSGRNRIIRRIFEYLGYKVKKLDRVYFAGLTKKNLRRGQWRFLTPQELGMLNMGSYE